MSIPEARLMEMRREYKNRIAEQEARLKRALVNGINCKEARNARVDLKTAIRRYEMLTKNVMLGAEGSE